MFGIEKWLTDLVDVRRAMQVMVATLHVKPRVVTTILTDIAMQAKTLVSRISSVKFSPCRTEAATRNCRQFTADVVGFTAGENTVLPDLFFELDREGRYLNVWAQDQGATAINRREALVGKTIREVLPPPQADIIMDALAEADRVAATQGHVIALDLSDGTRRWFEHALAKKPGDSPAADTFLAHSYDITWRKRVEEMLANREREFQMIVENSRDTIVRYDRAFRRVYANPAFAALAGVALDALIGQTPLMYMNSECSVVFEEKLRAVFASGEPIEFEYARQTQYDRQVCQLIKLIPEFNAEGAVSTVLAVGHDITDLRASYEKIHQMAFYDGLTGLPNRTLLTEEMDRRFSALSAAETGGVMVIDVDRFKNVNDTMGHAAGDRLLREAGQRLAGCLRRGDMVGRFGGDEFAVLLGPADACAASGVAKAILEQFDRSFVLNGKEVFVSCSIGIALYPIDTAKADDLMKYADSAMSLAKRRGRRGFRFYSRELTRDAAVYFAMESALRRAVENEELELYFQPKVSLGNNEVVGSEALLRWHRPGYGMVAPNEFIPIAEETGLIVQLDAWVLRDACRTAVGWNTNASAIHKVAVNLSARQFQSRDLARAVSEMLRETGCRPEWLELEITESLLLEKDDAILSNLSAFESMGISIAIDDFGTGYSSLSYLARFPIDTLKIDRSFVQKVTTDERYPELVKAILSIAQCLGLEVVAEGVETVEQSAFLAASGCQTAQGFLYSRPLTKAEMTRLPRYIK